MLVVWFLGLPWVLSAAKKCIVNQNVKVSQVLDSLECYNDYKSYLHCQWREEPEQQSNRRLQLRFKRRRNIEACRDYPSDMEGIRECRFETKIFSPMTSYKAFFNDPLELCSSIQHTPQDLSQLLRALEPVNLTTSSTDDRGRLITWSSPYPQSSALNDDFMYEVNYRQHEQNAWTVVVQKHKQMKLDKEKLILGHGYEVRVRARTKQSQWSNWSPTVSWHTPHDLKQAPRVHCVLWGEQEAWCSWEQSIEQGHFISYQLVCRPNHTATSQDCCRNLTMTREQRKDTVRFSCLLPLTQSTPLIQLVPTHNAKTFKVMQHIRPYPPTKVNVTQRGNIWVVEWSPAEIKDTELAHEVRYYSQQDEEDAVTIPSNDFSINILGSSLTPSRRYWVKVRSLVVPPYNGPPSDWSPSVAWTPQAATWPNWIYASVALLVAVVFTVVFIVHYIRVVWWDESIPSPKKSKVILDLKTVRTYPATVSEETYLCKVIDMDSMSTCSTIMSLWPIKRLNTQTEEVEADDEGIWSCDNIPVFPLDKSSMSFSGPYIFCQSIESKPMEEDSCDQTEVFGPVVGCPVDMTTAQSEEGYVRLPSPTVSTSVQDLSTQSFHGNDEQSSGNRERTQHCLSMDYASEAFWPQGGTIQGSGYCQLPADCTQTEPS